MPALPTAETHVIEYTDDSGNVWTLTVKSSIDVAVNGALDGYVERVQLGIATPYQSHKEALLHAVIINWNATNPDGSAAAITLENIRRLPGAVLEEVYSLFREKREAKEETSPLAASTSPSSTETGS